MKLPRYPRPLVVSMVLALFAQPAGASAGTPEVDADPPAGRSIARGDAAGARSRGPRPLKSGRLPSPMRAAASAAAQAPANDRFADAAALPPAPTSVSGDSLGSTIEMGEPLPCGEMGATVWYRFTPEQDGFLIADTFGSDYDTVLAAYEGSSLGSLALLDCNDDAFDLQSEVAFDVFAGETYHVQVGGFAGEAGPYVLSVSADGGSGAGAVISGRVVGEEGPVEACIGALDAGNRWHGYIWTMEPDGSYAYQVPSGGQYRLVFEDCSASPRYMAEWYDDRPDADAADPISVADGGTVTGIDAVLSLGGSISGRLTAPDGSALEGCVEAYDADDPWAWAGDAETDPVTGGYSIGGLASGDYRVFAYDCIWPVQYPGTWHRSAADFDSADPVSVTAGQDTGGIDVAVRPGGSISGRVSDGAGRPLSNVCVDVYDLEGFWVSGADTLADGSYTAGGIPVADHKVEFVDCFEDVFPGEWFDDKRDFASADPVPVTDGSVTTGIDAVLGRGSISGTVLGASGAPLGDVCVDLFEPAGQRIRTAQTANGTYRFDSVDTGDYAIRFRGCTPGDYVTEWYDDRPDQASADPVRVTEGSETAGIDAVLGALGSISGSVRNTAGSPLPAVCVGLHGGGEPVDSTTTGSTGRYSFSSVPEGSYTLHFDPCASRDQYASEWFDDRREAGLADPVVVVGGRSTVADARLERWGRVTGVVTDHRGESLAGVCVEAYAAGGELATSTTTSAAGGYELGELPEDAYRIRFGCDGSSIATEWYRDRPSFETADPVPVALDQVVTGIDASLQGADLLIEETGGGTAAAEAGPADTFSVQLATQPSSQVHVALQADDEVMVDPAALVIDASSWGQPQVVSIEARNDGKDEPDASVEIGLVASSVDAGYDGVSRGLQVQVLDNDTPTVLEFLGPTEAVRGTTATLEAALRSDDGRPVAGRSVHFAADGADLGNAVTDDAGVASVEVPVQGPYGAREIEIRFGGDWANGDVGPEEFEESAVVGAFDVTWEHEFADGDRVLRVNTITQELQFAAPGDVSDVASDPDMSVSTVPTGDAMIEIELLEGDLMVAGRFVPARGTFFAAVRTPASPYVLVGTP